MEDLDPEAAKLAQERQKPDDVKSDSSKDFEKKSGGYCCLIF